jgi:hypothetical protein
MERKLKTRLFRKATFLRTFNLFFAVLFPLLACSLWAQSNVTVFAQGLNNPAV